MDPRPVLYLDIDDTILSWAQGRPEAVETSGAFLRWALERFEVRWLTRWAPDGRMPMNLLHDLARMTGVEPGRLARIRGLDWGGAASKLDGIAWLEHVVLGRPFVWLEDEQMEGQLPFLRASGWEWCYVHCNISEEPERLMAVREQLEARFGGLAAGARK